MSKEELIAIVCVTCLYTSAKKKDGVYYKSSSMKSIRAAIYQFPRPPLHNKQMDEKNIIRRWEFNKTIIIPFALVGHDIGNSQLGATCLVGYLPFRIQRGLME